MENKSIIFDKNLLLGILFPLLFLIAFYIYYRVDLYYSEQYLKNITPKEKIADFAVITQNLPYNLIYALDSRVDILDNSKTTTIPFSEIEYQFPDLYLGRQNRPAEIHVFEECVVDVDSNIVYLSQSDGVVPKGTADPEKDYAEILYFQKNRVFSYNFNTSKIEEIGCNSSPNFIAFDYMDRGTSIRSPDGRLDLKIRYEDNLLYSQESDNFPYLKSKLISEEESKNITDFSLNYGSYIIIDRQKVDPDSIILDPISKNSYGYYGGSEDIQILGWEINYGR